MLQYTEYKSERIFFHSEFNQSKNSNFVTIRNCAF